MVKLIIGDGDTTQPHLAVADSVIHDATCVVVSETGIRALVSCVPEEELKASLNRLVASELVIQRGTPPEAVYSFKHALVQDTAYSTLLRGPRQALHRRIAEALQ